MERCDSVFYKAFFPARPKFGFGEIHVCADNYFRGCNRDGIPHEVVLKIIFQCKLLLMGKIQILPDTLISQIAAGEVVERPASVVKELLENSLDAGSSFCWIEIEQGGMKLISVRDNGTGMEDDDAKMAFERHATSKISNLDDLTQIKTFGFRGEALAAIASVSLMMLRTRTNASASGCEIVFKGGKMESQNPIGCPPGTEISVRNLFFNTPARKKFLKTENTELSHIAATVSHTALAYPSVGFSLKHNGKTILEVPQNSAPQIRLASVLGKNFVKECVPVSFKTESIHIYGFVGQPGMSLSSKRHQYLFVNGRDVSDPLVSRAVVTAYGTRLPAREWPMYLLHVDIDPSEVDVNVHPRKLSVKFLDTQRVFRDVSQAVVQALDGHQKEMFGTAGGQSGQYGQTSVGGGYSGGKVERFFGGAVQDALTFSQNFLELTKRPDGLEMANVNAKTFQILGQFANSYILILDEEGLAIVDQHAAHERILYEKFKSKTGEKAPEIQPLLTPIQIECSREEAVFLKQALEYLSKMGFEFDEWSGNTFVIRACPSALKKENLQKLFMEFLNDVMSENQKEKILPERILKSMACKAAIKFGMQITRPEQEELLRELAKTPNNSTCPHGRPTRILLTFDELEKRFYRRGG